MLIFYSYILRSFSIACFNSLWHLIDVDYPQRYGLHNNNECSNAREVQHSCQATGNYVFYNYILSALYLFCITCNKKQWRGDTSLKMRPSLSISLKGCRPYWQALSRQQRTDFAAVSLQSVWTSLHVIHPCRFMIMSYIINKIRRKLDSNFCFSASNKRKTAVIFFHHVYLPFKCHQDFLVWNFKIKVL